MPLPILGAVAAVGKGLVVGTAKAAVVGAKAGAKATISTGKFFGKKTFNIANSLSNNAKNLNKFLEKQNKNQDKLRSKKREEKQKSQSIEKKKEKENQLESKRDSSNQKKTELNLAKSPLNILNKLFGFGGLLLGGILVNAAQGLIDKAKQFMKDNEELFNTIGNFLSGVKDAAVGLFNAFTGPESEQSWFDDIATFGDDGKLTGGALLEVDKAYDKLEEMLKSVMPALKGTKPPSMPTKEELVNQTERRSGMASFREDNAENAALQESVRGQTSEGSSTGPASSGTTLNYGLVNPTPNTNILENKGGYAADTGLDIIGKVGDPIVSPVDGILEYAERGHTAQMGQDSDPTKPGIQDQLSFRIRLNKPFTFDGKKVNFVYGTHLATLDAGVANKFDIPIKAGQRLGTMGVANNVPHLHIGSVEDRAQTGFLNFKEVRRLLSGQSSNGEKKGAAGLLKGSRDERNKQMNAINQPDPTDEEVATLFIQRVNTIQYIPVPT